MKLVKVLLVLCSIFVSNKASSRVGRDGLPCPSLWPHRPLLFKASDETTIWRDDKLDTPALPIGIPVEFETPLFKGRVLLRIRHGKSDSEKEHIEYFNGRKRIMQTVVQGRFKKPIRMSDLYVGSVFKKPLEQVPPPFLSRMINAVMRRVAPGVILDLDSPNPRVIALYSGTAESISVDRPGEEPDMMAPDLPENMTAIFGDKKFKSNQHRKKQLSDPAKAAQYSFDTEHVYTLHTFEEQVNYGTYSIQIPMYGEYNLADAIGRQPMSLTAITSQGDLIYSFDVWHESLLDA